MTTCSVENCARNSTKRGMCNRHYIRWRRHGDPNAMLVNRYGERAACLAEDCTRAPIAKALCKAHYERNAKYGDPNAGAPPRRDWPGRFWGKVNKSGLVPASRPDLGPCWLWTGSKTKRTNGYGAIRLNGVMAVAHRVAYELLVGPIPDGLDLDHLCRIRLCVNPKHVEPVSPYENFIRGESVMSKRRRQTHCHRGHPLSGTNVAIVNKGRSRRCRECKRINERARRTRARR